MQKNKHRRGFFGLKAKILIPILLICLAIMIGAIVLVSRSCYWIFENTIDTQLLACFGEITDHKIVFLDNGTKPEIEDSDVFDCIWAEDTDLMYMLYHSGCIAAVYRYEPEHKRFVVDNAPFGAADYMPEISGEPASLLLNNGYLRFPDIGNEQTAYFWDFILEKHPPAGQPPRAIGAGVDAHELAVNLFEFLAFAILILIAAIAIIIIIICIIITRMIKRIRRVSGYLETVSAESLPTDPLLIRSRDEIGNMSDTVNRMVNGLKDRNRMESELNVAAEIQQNMLPKPLPANSRFILDASMCAAKEVAGDFYDFFMLDDRHLVILIADVSGKGVPAALFMAIGKKLLRNSMRSGLSPKDAVTSVNASLADENKLSHFITAWVGVLDLDTGELTYTNAGHNPPYVLGKPFLTLSDIHGTPLAVFKQTYEETTVILHPGDILFLYTDGVNEAFNQNGVMYTTERLVSELQAFDTGGEETLIEYIDRSVNTFRGEAEQSDDITMLSLTLLENKP